MSAFLSVMGGKKKKPRFSQKFPLKFFPVLPLLVLLILQLGGEGMKLDKLKGTSQ